MIIDTEYMKYDMDEHYYYLTEAGLTELTMVVTEWTNVTVRLKRQGQQIHDAYTRSAYKERTRYSHKDLIEYKVFKNQYDEVNFIKKALVNYADLADLKDADLDYLETNKLPYSVMTPLYDADIYFRGRIKGYVPEDEYRVGY